MRVKVTHTDGYTESWTIGKGLTIEAIQESFIGEKRLIDFVERTIIAIETLSESDN